MDTTSFISSLTEQTTGIKDFASGLKFLDMDLLTWRADAGSWNILECLEHLNLYGDFYLPEFASRINHSRKDSDPVFKSGLLGNYFANSMLPGAKMKKMKTFKDKNPLNAPLDKQVIDRFIKQQDQLLELLERAKNVSLNKTKISISITKLIKLKLGDGFRFYINHMKRHMKQIERIASQRDLQIRQAQTSKA